MIKEVKINFVTGRDASNAAMRDSMQTILTGQENLSSFIANLNGRAENYCVVVHVVSAGSLAENAMNQTQLHPILSTLTKRESEILNLAIRGLSNKQISQKLFITVETVKSHRKSIVNKAGVSRVEDIKNWLLNRNI